MKILVKNSCGGFDVIENIKGVKLIQDGNFEDWMWGYRYYHEGASDEYHYIDFDELVACVDSQDDRNRPEHFDNLEISKFNIDMDYYTKDVLK